MGKHGVVSREIRQSLYRKWWQNCKQKGCCPEWDDFETFIKWALENGYEDGFYLLRKDKRAPFSPDNCLWGAGESEPKDEWRAEAIKKWNETVNRIRVACGMEPFDV